MDEFENEFAGIDDVSADLEESMTDNTADIDIDSMSLDELYSLRDKWTNGVTSNLADSVDCIFDWEDSDDNGDLDDPDDEPYVYVLKR